MSPTAPPTAGTQQAELVLMIQERARHLPRGVGWIQRTLANTIHLRGAPSSSARPKLRRLQAEVVARPSDVEIAVVVAARIARAPHEGGLPSLEEIGAEVAPQEG